MPDDQTTVNPDLNRPDWDCALKETLLLTFKGDTMVTMVPGQHIYLASKIEADHLEHLGLASIQGQVIHVPFIPGKREISIDLNE
jgi:hypothetical protein